jgi:hypothetical protein
MCFGYYGNFRKIGTQPNAASQAIAVNAMEKRTQNPHNPLSQNELLNFVALRESREVSSMALR